MLLILQIACGVSIALFLDFVLFKAKESFDFMSQGIILLVIYGLAFGLYFLINHFVGD